MHTNDLVKKMGIENYVKMATGLTLQEFAKYKLEKQLALLELQNKKPTNCNNTH